MPRFTEPTVTYRERALRFSLPPPFFPFRLFPEVP